jgi:molybdopterin-guanine dinucleotide biosynthesis protein A
MISVAILAGGKSSRMGADKSFSTVLGQPMIERVFAQVQGLGGETLLITNQPEAYAYLDLPLYADLFPNSGPLGGICTALHHATGSHTLVLACDLPFLSRDLLEHLIHLSPAFDIVVPQALGRLQPLHALYSRACLQPALACLRRGELKVNAFYQAMPRLHVVMEEAIQLYDPTQQSFWNVNTPQELDQANQAQAFNLNAPPWPQSVPAVKPRRRVGDK